MPAISPAQLRIQSNELALSFRDTEQFIQNLYDLLERYGDRSYRSGITNVTRPLVPTMNVPDQVIRQIALAVREVAEQDQDAFLALCNALWLEQYLESCLLAGKLLGSAALMDDVVLDTINSWQPHLLDEEFQRNLFNDIFSSMVRENPEKMLSLADTWLESPEWRKKITGLLLLERLVKDPDYENSPVIFRRINPLLRNTPPELRSSASSVLSQLARRFPSETTFILTENLTATDNPDTHLFVRQVIVLLPIEMQKSLRKFLQKPKRT